MKFKKMILSSLLLGAAICVNAQEQKTQEVDVFNPHWYLQAQIGGQHTLGEVDFGDLLSPNAQLGVGYNFHENMGVRFSVNAWQSKAGWHNSGQTWKWNYVAPAVDLNINLSNVLLGYDANRKVNVNWFVGVGANIAFNNDEAYEVESVLCEQRNTDENLSLLWDGTKVRLQGRTGLSADYRINDTWSVGLELQANVLNDRYNSKKAGNPDWYFNGLVGVKYNLGKTTTKKTVVLPTSERIIERVIERVPEKTVTPTPAAATSQVNEEIRRDVFFTISATKITAAEMQKVKEVAEFMKKHPNTKVKITGHADKGTGNATINQRLSNKRAEVVANALVQQYGIAESRIEKEGRGDKDQPYAENELNRVSICIVK